MPPRRKKSEQIEPSGHRCHWAGCDQPGDFRAPKSRHSVNEYQWFCEPHIVQFNKNWNYFEGMSEDQIYAFQRDAAHGHRPTWRADQLGPNPTQKLEEAFERMFGVGGGPTGRSSSQNAAAARPISAKVKDALAVLDLEHPSDKPTVKAQYRELVKKYHPDLNRNNPRAEDTFKRITASYHYLVEHYLES